MQVVHSSFASSSASSSSFLSSVPVSPLLHLSTSSPMSYSSASGQSHHSVPYPSSSSSSDHSSSFRGYQYPTFSNNPAPQSDLHLSLPPPNIPSSSRDHGLSRYPTSDPWAPHARSSQSVAPSRRSPVDLHRGPQASMMYPQPLPRHQPSPPLPSPIPSLGTTRSVLPSPSSYASSSNVPRLPPILQVEKQQVTTSATQAASASRRRNEAHFVCPVPGCGSTFTRRFNLRGMCSNNDTLEPLLIRVLFPGTVHLLPHRSSSFAHCRAAVLVRLAWM